ncbi:MAG: hypothetical protein J7M38_14300, partial [Armatimonadetes bacterium]|nr:hypothetical protein [Armatimonadota bacterium]
MPNRYAWVMVATTVMLVCGPVPSAGDRGEALKMSGYAQGELNVSGDEEPVFQLRRSRLALRADTSPEDYFKLQFDFSLLRE